MRSDAAALHSDNAAGAMGNSLTPRMAAGEKV
jgi:hypothetical protein